MTTVADRATTPIRDTHTRPAQMTPTVLITEHEVKLLTAAAIGVAAPAHRGLWRRVTAAAQAAFAVRPVDERPAHSRYVPRHNDFLETAAMKRAMERL